jgi:hypothetical protein
VQRGNVSLSNLQVLNAVLRSRTGLQMARSAEAVHRYTIYMRMSLVR